MLDVRDGVLVMEFMEGARVTDIAAIRALNLEPQQVATMLAEGIVRD